MDLELLKSERRKLGITQEQMGEYLGFKGRSNYCLMEKGKISISVDVANKIAHYLGLSEEMTQKIFFGGLQTGDKNTPVFSTRITELRKSSGMTQKELADALGITRSALSTYELGIREPNISTLVDISRFFGTSVDYIVGRDAPERFSREELINELRHRFPGLKTDEVKGISNIIDRSRFRLRRGEETKCSAKE